MGLSTTTASINKYYHFIKQLGSQGSGNGQFVNPFGIAVDSSGNVYVVDSGNDRVEVFAANSLITSNSKNINSNSKNITLPPLPQSHAGITDQF